MVLYFTPLTCYILHEKGPVANCQGDLPRLAIHPATIRLQLRQLQQQVELYPSLKLAVTFDSWYTQPGFCHFIDRLGLAYVGTLTAEAELVLKTGREQLDSFAARLKIDSGDYITKIGSLAGTASRSYSMAPVTSTGTICPAGSSFSTTT